jgi:hypothetical protein
MASQLRGTNRMSLLEMSEMRELRTARQRELQLDGTSCD